MHTTKLTSEDILPLTCARIGACCHGNLVLLNPWELFSIAKEKKITPREFRDLYCEYGGIRLSFNGKKGWREKQSCSQYIENFGCSVHLGRPLACRLFPIGRQIQNNTIQYMHVGDQFPCLEGCPEVLKLPKISVGDYLKGQMTEMFEQAQDGYMELMQNLADIAFELLLDTGLAESGDKKTLPLWRKMSTEIPEILASQIGTEWIDCLTIPAISTSCEDPIVFVQKHNELLQLKAQDEFGALQTNKEFRDASVLIMGVAIHLARGLGANPEILVEHWINTAKQHGAGE